MFLSKSDYMMADGCIKALWLKKNRKDLTPEIDEATQKRFDIGNAVQDLAREFFPGGVMVPAENWDVINGSKITAEEQRQRAHKRHYNPGHCYNHKGLLNGHAEFYFTGA